MKYVFLAVVAAAFGEATAITNSTRKLQSSDWDGPFDTNIVAAGAANLPGGDVLLWSGQRATHWGGGGSTLTVRWNPTNNDMDQETVRTNSHNMFCPGTTNMADGRLMITGGQDSDKTTFFDAGRNQWTAGRDMNIDRGYQAQTMLANGDVFVLGGSWGVPNNDRGDKNGELWSESSGRWSLLSGVQDDPFLTNDREGVYRSDNHMWLFLAPDNRIFHAGPSRQMHWITPTGNGSVRNSVRRGNDDDAMNGNAVMYDIGRILTVGGAEHYGRGDGSNRAYTIDINGNEANVRQTGSMRFGRTLGNSVVLPSGEVITIGGVDEARLFSDDGSRLAPEIWNPSTGRWSTLDNMRVPRNYHSTALLLKDGRVMAGGGGLCNCDADHPDVEILSPPYLFNGNRLATRPRIQSSPSRIRAGDRFQVRMDSSGAHTFALVRLSSITHSVNNDCRRIPLSASRSGSTFTLTVPSNPAVALAGAYYLFAMNSAGVPSIGEDILIQLGGSPSPPPPPPPAPAPSSDENGCTSNLSRSGACCLASCGECGGRGCGNRSGGRNGCCTSAILDANRSCSNNPPPCVV